MTEIFEMFKSFIENLSMDQMGALIFGIAILYAAKEVVKEGLSLIISIVGILFILYFAAPELYYSLFDMLGNFFGSL